MAVARVNSWSPAQGRHSVSSSRKELLSASFTVSPLPTCSLQLQPRRSSTFSVSRTSHAFPDPSPSGIGSSSWVKAAFHKLSSRWKSLTRVGRRVPRPDAEQHGVLEVCVEREDGGIFSVGLISMEWSQTLRDVRKRIGHRFGSILPFADFDFHSKGLAFAVEPPRVLRRLPRTDEKRYVLKNVSSLKRSAQAFPRVTLLPKEEHPNHADWKSSLNAISEAYGAYHDAEEEISEASGLDVRGASGLGVAPGVAVAAISSFTETSESPPSSVSNKKRHSLD